MKTVAALYVQRGGIYWGRAYVDPWDEERDARLYDGPWPVVAHPPCGPWSRLRHLCTKQDPTCGPRAVQQVQRWGGVLEHPAGSKLWEHCGLPLPGEATDGFGGRTFVVRQVDWGHCCEKKTWLYVVRVDQRKLSRTLARRNGSRVATHCVSRDARRMSSVLIRCSSKAASATPPAFAELLLALARESRLDDR